jgi:hypothetical protein
MATAPRIIWLDVETPKAHLSPIRILHPRDIRRALDLSQQHDSRKRAEPVRAECLEWEGVDHWVRVAALDLERQLAAQEGDEGRGDLGERGEWEDRGFGAAVAEGDMSGGEIWGGAGPSDRG